MTLTTILLCTLSKSIEIANTRNFLVNKHIKTFIKNNFSSIRNVFYRVAKQIYNLQLKPNLVSECFLSFTTATGITFKKIKQNI